MLQGLSTEVDICELLHAMKLGRSELPESERVGARSSALAIDIDDSNMPEASACHHDEPSRSSSPSETETYQGCAYLQAIQSQLEKFPTTGGEYIESIFTHRQIFFAFPGGHRCCARAFSDLACSLQRRDRRADRDADMEAANAFHYEAQFIASIML